MRNPWLELPKGPPHILPEDLAIIQRSKTTPAKLGLRLEVLPVPYLGNPIEAKILLLCLNPGFSQQDLRVYDNDPKCNEENIKTLTFESNPPFFYLNQKFSDTGGYKWWSKILKECLARFGEDRVSHKFMCLQYIAYHSVTFINPPSILESQNFTFDLLRKAMNQEKIIVVMRSKKLWIRAVPKLENYPYIELKNYRRPFISKRNMKEGDFERIVVALKG